MAWQVAHGLKPQRFTAVQANQAISH